MREGFVSVLDLRPGEKGRVQEILSGRGWGKESRRGQGCRSRHGERYRGGRGCGRSGGCTERLLEVLGVYRGQILEVVENRGCGPVVLRVGDSRFILGRGQAARILVEKLQKGGEA